VTYYRVDINGALMAIDRFSRVNRCLSKLAIPLDRYLAPSRTRVALTSRGPISLADPKREHSSEALRR